MKPHEQLDQFFGEFFRLLRQADPSTYFAFLRRAEAEFKRLGYREEIPIGVENILIIRLDEFGDVVLTSGFIREVRKNFPHARITLVVKSLARPMVELCPYVNEVLTFDQKNLTRNFPKLFETLAVFCRDNLWQKHFSIVFSPKWDGDQFPGVFMAWLSGARERVGYGVSVQRNWIEIPPHFIEQDNFLLTKNILTPRDVIAMPARHLYLLEAVGLKVNQTHNELWFGAADIIQACELLKDIPPNCKKVLLSIGGNNPCNKYPVEKYLVALRELAKKDLVFVIVGGKSEIDDANFIERSLPQGKILNLVGKTTLRETEAVISLMDFYLGNVTGVMHMAAAAQVPVLTLYQEAQDRENIVTGVFSSFRKFPPWQTKAVVLRPDHPLGDCATLPPIHSHCHHKEAHCITQIPPQEIIEGFEILETL